MPQLQFNLVIAVVTLLAWLLSSERKIPPAKFLTITMFVLLAWMTFNSFFAFQPEWSWPFWDRTWKIFLLGFLVAATATNRVRIQTVIWVLVISIFYYGVKGGLFTIITGGTNRVLGPPSTIIGDNNQLAVALLMTLPLANYLRRYSINIWMRRGLAIAMLLTFVATVGTYSRGALIALATLTVAWLLRTRRRLTYLVLVGFGVLFLVSFMPHTFWNRAETIESAGHDASFEARLTAWQVSYFYARDHFPFGAGFYGPQLAPIYNGYFPGAVTHAAHSIYFQVLGEHGFIGLFIYLALIAGTFLKTAQIIIRTRDVPEWQWATNLVRMIQLSLVAFCSGGAALSMAYYDVFIILIGALVALDQLTSEESTHYLADILAPNFAPDMAPTKVEADSLQTGIGNNPVNTLGAEG